MSGLFDGASNLPPGVSDRDIDAAFGGTAHDDDLCATCAGPLTMDYSGRWDRHDECKACRDERDDRCAGDCKQVDPDTGRCLDCDAQIAQVRPLAHAALTSARLAWTVCGARGEDITRIAVTMLTEADIQTGRHSLWALCPDCLKPLRER